MKIHFLGTNGWFDTKTGNTPCILIDSREGYVIFDAGIGIYKISQYIKEKKPVALFISHFHLDHVFGVHVFSQFKLPGILNIYLAKGRTRDFTTLANPPYTTTKIPLKIHELNEGKNSIGFTVEVVPLHHAYDDHGFRVHLEGKVIAYSGDSGICPNSQNLAQDADLLIHECSKIKIDNKNWGHVTPQMAATLAKEAGAKKLALTHFDPTNYTNLAKRRWAEKVAKEIFPNTIAAIDGLTIEL